MSPLFTLLGVLLGAAATYTVTASNERTRWRRAQESRWDDRRVHSHLDYANAVKTCIHVSSRIVAFRGLPAGGQPLDPETGLAQLAEAEHERSVKWENIQLLGSNAVIEAARRWHRIAWRLEKIARGEEADEAVTAVFAAHNAARGEFFRCARADLGLREARDQRSACAAVTRSRCGWTGYFGSSADATPAWNRPNRVHAEPAVLARPPRTAAVRDRPPRR